MSSRRPVLTGGDAERARHVALEVGSRLADPERVERAHARAVRALARAGIPAADWSTPGLSGANSSVALVCAQLDRLAPDAGWDRAGHARLAAAARVAERAVGPLGLFDGVAGLGFAAQRLGADRPRYGSLLSSLDELIAGSAGALCARLALTGGMPVRAWDLISGITGVGVYLLARRTLPTPRAALDRTLTALVDLAREVDGAPRWATPPEHLFEDMRESAPQGNLNCGLAHGAPGPVAFMSLALANGVEVSGQVDAIRRMAAWVADRARPGRFGPEWPAAIRLGARSTADPEPPARPAWCYGNAGVARSLWLAGRALNQPEHLLLAEQAVRQALERQRAVRPLDSPTLCHGVAGLAQVALRMAADSGAQDLARDARSLCLGLIERFDGDALLGFRGVAEARCRPRVEIDDPTLLAGAAGPPLVLLAAATEQDAGWDRAMLLS